MPASNPASKPISTPAPAPVFSPETIVVDHTHVACEGVGGTLGHPKVYLEMGEADLVECGYCDRRFVLSEKAREARAKGEHV